MIEGGKYPDSLEELNTPQHITDLKVTKSIHFRFRIQNLRRFEETGRFFSIYEYETYKTEPKADLG